jgi:hypothetical protein
MTTLRRVGLRQKKRKHAELRAALREAVLLHWGRHCVMASRTPNSGFGACAGPIDTSHLMPKGAWPQLEYDLENVRPMCRKHHRQWHDTRLTRQWFEAKFPGVMETLRSRALVRGSRMDPEETMSRLTGVRESLLGGSL